MFITSCDLVVMRLYVTLIELRLLLLLFSWA